MWKKRRKKPPFSVSVLTDLMGYKRRKGWRDGTAAGPGAAQTLGGKASASCFAAG